MSGIKELLSLFFVLLLNLILVSKIPYQVVTIELSHLPGGRFKRYCLALQISILLNIPIKLVIIKVDGKIYSFSSNGDKFRKIVLKLTKSSLPKEEVK